MKAGADVYIVYLKILSCNCKLWITLNHHTEFNLIKYAWEWRLVNTGKTQSYALYRCWIDVTRPGRCVGNHSQRFTAFTDHSARSAWPGRDDHNEVINWPVYNRLSTHSWPRPAPSNNLTTYYSPASSTWRALGRCALPWQPSAAQVQQRNVPQLGGYHHRKQSYCTAEQSKTQSSR